MIYRVGVLGLGLWLCKYLVFCLLRRGTFGGKSTQNHQRFPKGPASKGGEQSEAILARSDKTPTVALDPTSRGVCTVVMYFPCGEGVALCL